MKVRTCLLVAFLVSPVFSLPSRPKKPHGTERVHATELSKEQHFPEAEKHNTEFDHEAFLGADEARKFNKLTPEESQERLRKLVPKVDTDKDGFVTEEELKNWIKFTQSRYVNEDVERQWKSHDVDGDGSVSWDEYRNSTYGPMAEEDNHSENTYKDMIGRDKRRWEAAVTNSEKRMGKTEFGAFLHPEEHEHMRMLVVQETLEDIDKDKDGRLSIDEYLGDMYPEEDRKPGEEEPEWVRSERESFKSYRDKNGDGFMDQDEVKHWIVPEDYDHAESEAKHLLYESDTEPKDNKLSVDEIVQKYDLFAGSQATDYGEALNRHDEF